MVTAASLKLHHPEFDPADNALVTAMIADATANVDDTVVSATQLDGVVEWYACHLLALSPFGRDLRLARDDSTSVYGDELLRRTQAAGRMYRVLP